MERRGLLKAALLVCLLVICSAREPTFKHQLSTTIYNSTLAKTLVEYASAIYTADLTQLFTWTCARCGDLIEGFEMIELIVDVENCLQTYIGFASDINAVVVVFRGTQENSIQNWIEDLLWKQLDLDYPGMPEAMVHRGFYSAYHNTTLRDGVVNGIQKTRKFYGDVPIMITGHSMGGAMASFCALDLAGGQSSQKTAKSFSSVGLSAPSAISSDETFKNQDIIYILVKWPKNNQVVIHGTNVQYLVNHQVVALASFGDDLSSFLQLFFFFELNLVLFLVYTAFYMSEQLVICHIFLSCLFTFLLRPELRIEEEERGGRGNRGIGKQ